MNFDISEGARKILSALNQKGYDAYIVGGAIRDLIMGRTPHDYDIATSALPNQIKSIFYKSTN